MWKWWQCDICGKQFRRMKCSCHIYNQNVIGYISRMAKITLKEKISSEARTPKRCDMRKLLVGCTIVLYSCLRSTMVQPTGCMEIKLGYLIASRVKAFTGRQTNSGSTLLRAAHLESDVIGHHLCLTPHNRAVLQHFPPHSQPLQALPPMPTNHHLHPCPHPTHHNYN